MGQSDYESTFDTSFAVATSLKEKSFFIRKACLIRTDLVPVSEDNLKES